MNLTIFIKNLFKNIKLAVKSSYISSLSKKKINSQINNFDKIEYNNEFGIVYIVSGDSFNKETLMSIKSLRRFNNYPICVFTDCPDLYSGMNLYKVVKINKVHTRSKVDYILRSPFNKTLYLDSDTLINYNLKDFEILLDRFDVCATLDSARKRISFNEFYRAYYEIPYAFSEVNGGILAFRKAKITSDFLDLWHEEYYKNNFITKNWDQPSLRVALWKSKVKLYILPPEYNVRSKDHIHKNLRMKALDTELMKPRIFHLHYNREVHKNIFSLNDFVEYEKLIKDKAIKIDN